MMIFDRGDIVRPLRVEKGCEILYLSPPWSELKLSPAVEAHPLSLAVLIGLKQCSDGAKPRRLDVHAARREGEILDILHRMNRSIPADPLAMGSKRIIGLFGECRILDPGGCEEFRDAPVQLDVGWLIDRSAMIRTFQIDHVERIRGGQCLTQGIIPRAPRIQLEARGRHLLPELHHSVKGRRLSQAHGKNEPNRPKLPTQSMGERDPILPKRKIKRRALEGPAAEIGVPLRRGMRKEIHFVEVFGKAMKSEGSGEWENDIPFLEGDLLLNLPDHILSNAVMSLPLEHDDGRPALPVRCLERETLEVIGIDGQRKLSKSRIEDLVHGVLLLLRVVRVLAHHPGRNSSEERSAGRRFEYNRRRKRRKEIREDPMTSSKNPVFDVLIVGGGIAGSAATLRAAQYTLSVAWIRGDKKTAKASRAKYVYNIDNMIGIHPDIMRRKFLALLDDEEHQAVRELLGATHVHIGTQDLIQNVLHRIQRDFSAQVTVVDERASSASRQNEHFRITTGSGAEYAGRNVVLATGVMDRQPKIKREVKEGKIIDDIQWLYPYANHETLLYCIRCEGHLARETPAVVIGSSETTAQVAMMLHERYGVSISILTNGEALTASTKTQQLLNAYQIRIFTTRIVEILEGQGPPKGTTLRGFWLEDGTEVEARFGLVAMGLFRVYNELASQLGAELEPEEELPQEERHVMVDEASSETSVRNLFAVGDMSLTRGDSPSMKQIYTAQEYAVRAIDTIDRRRRRANREAILAGSTD